MKSYLLTCFLVAIAACSREEPAGDHDHDQAAEFERGPHNGRLLEHEGFALEIAILESGVPPEFRVYLYEDDKQQ
jgi:cobalt-zinc-cadmium efflux system membrane fusion protein